MSVFAQNVGPLDAALRIVAAVALLVGAVASLRAFDADWALTLLIHPAILAAYLLMTAAARNDVLYHFLGWSTMRHADAPRERYRMRLTPP